MGNNEENRISGSLKFVFVIVAHLEYLNHELHLYREKAHP